MDSSRQYARDYSVSDHIVLATGRGSDAVGVRQTNWDRAGRLRTEEFSNVAAWTGTGRVSRAALLACASLVALAVFVRPVPTLAACKGPDQTIAMAVNGPINSNGGAITVANAGSVIGLSGVTGSVGVGVGPACPATTVGNAGAISGGAGSRVLGMGGPGLGGAGVSNSSPVMRLINSGAISGGAGSSTSAPGNATGGAGVSNSGTMGMLTNRARSAAARALAPSSAGTRPAVPECGTLARWGC